MVQMDRKSVLITEIDETLENAKRGVYKPSRTPGPMTMFSNFLAYMSVNKITKLTPDSLIRYAEDTHRMIHIHPYGNLSLVRQSYQNALRDNLKRYMREDVTEIIKRNIERLRYDIKVVDEAMKKIDKKPSELTKTYIC